MFKHQNKKSAIYFAKYSAFLSCLMWIVNQSIFYTYKIYFITYKYIFIFFIFILYIFQFWRNISYINIYVKYMYVYFIKNFFINYNLGNPKNTLEKKDLLEGTFWSWGLEDQLRSQSCRRKKSKGRNLGRQEQPLWNVWMRWGDHRPWACSERHALCVSSALRLAGRWGARAPTSGSLCCSGTATQTVSELKWRFTRLGYWFRRFPSIVLKNSRLGV